MQMEPLRNTMKMYTATKHSLRDASSGTVLIVEKMCSTCTLYKSIGVTVITSYNYSLRDNTSHPTQKNVLKSELILTIFRLFRGGEKEAVWVLCCRAEEKGFHFYFIA